MTSVSIYIYIYIYIYVKIHIYILYIYIDKLADTVIKYSNTCHSTTKMKPIDGKPKSKS